MATALASTKAVNHKKKVGVSPALLVSVVDFVHFVFICRGIALAVEQGALLTNKHRESELQRERDRARRTAIDV